MSGIRFSESSLRALFAAVGYCDDPFLLLLSQLVLKMIADDTEGNRGSVVTPDFEITTIE